MMTSTSMSMMNTTNRRINEKTGIIENQVIYSITKDEFFEFNQKNKNIKI